MAGMRWARLKADLNLKLRRGAWYRIQDVGPLEAVVEVNNRPMPVPSAFLQIVETPPRRWTVVPRPANAVRMPDTWKHYAVCPSCRERAPLVRRPPVLECPRCRGIFEVGWDETYSPEL